MKATIQFLDICLPSYFLGYSEGTRQALICFPLPSPKLTVGELRNALIGQEMELRKEMELPEYCPVSQNDYYWAVEAYLSGIEGSENPSKVVWQVDPSELDEDGNIIEDAEREHIYLYFSLEW